MSWLGGGSKPTANGDQPAPSRDMGGAPGPDRMAGGRSAMPPQCPRCEVTKAQFNRTIQNYQKAFRKKVEGLKTELRAVRNTNDALRSQVRQLRSVLRVHVPSLALGIAAGVLAKTYWRLLQRVLAKPAISGGGPEQGDAVKVVETVQAEASMPGTVTGSPDAPELEAAKA